MYHSGYIVYHAEGRYHSGLTVIGIIRHQLLVLLHIVIERSTQVNSRHSHTSQYRHAVSPHNTPNIITPHNASFHYHQ